MYFFMQGYNPKESFELDKTKTRHRSVYSQMGQPIQFKVNRTMIREAGEMIDLHGS